MFIQSPMDWGLLFFAAMLIGMSKTGIQGISLLAVPLMAITFGAKASTGLILPILCTADLMAVLYYRRIADWKYVLKPLPAAWWALEWRFGWISLCRPLSSST